MMAEIIPEGYDIYGKKTLRLRQRKRKRYRIFHPTFPMGRFVSKPLTVKCSNIQGLRQFLQTCQYVHDMEQFHMRDYWLPPEEFERTRKGDCEDFALWTWRQMMALGYSARFIVGRSGKYGEGHAWVTIEKGGKHFLVEPLLCWHETFPRLNMLRYEPESSVEWDGKKMHYFLHEKRSYHPRLREIALLL